MRGGGGSTDKRRCTARFDAKFAREKDCVCAHILLRPQRQLSEDPLPRDALRGSAWMGMEPPLSEICAPPAVSMTVRLAEPAYVRKNTRGKTQFFGNLSWDTHYRFHRQCRELKRMRAGGGAQGTGMG